MNYQEINMTIEDAKFNTLGLSLLLGYKIVESKLMVDIIQRRKHKKSRINKKWKKRYGYYEIPKKDIYFFGNQIIGHPETLKHLDKLQ